MYICLLVHNSPNKMQLQQSGSSTNSIVSIQLVQKLFEIRPGDLRRLVSFQCDFIYPRQICKERDSRCFQDTLLHTCTVTHIPPRQKQQPPTAHMLRVWRSHIVWWLTGTQIYWNTRWTLLNYCHACIINCTPYYGGLFSHQRSLFLRHSVLMR